jgi:hypothetical protein
VLGCASLRAYAGGAQAAAASEQAAETSALLVAARTKARPRSHRRQLSSFMALEAREAAAAEA